MKADEMVALPAEPIRSPDPTTGVHISWLQSLSQVRAALPSLKASEDDYASTRLLSVESGHPFSLFGADFILDSSLHPFLTEIQEVSSAITQWSLKQSVTISHQSAIS
jgi:hypothetical protein